MATQLWNKEIDKTVDWGGDTSTGGAAVSGQFVQKFIKDTLAKKFGYLNYDRDNLKYQVFADESDYNLWKNDPLMNANLLLATFDAPSPADINARITSAERVTILTSETGQKIELNYYILDKSGNAMNEQINVKMTVTNNGISQTFTTSWEPDYDGYNKKDEAGNWIGTNKSIAIDNYLTEGTNNITIVLTGASTQATATLSAQYTLVNMVISSEFKNTVGQYYDSLMDPELIWDLDKGNNIKIPFYCSGQGVKYLEFFVNGQPLDQSEITGGIKSGDTSITDQSKSDTLYIFLTNKNGSIRAPFVDGKNTIQFRTYIIGADGEKIYSETLYYDVVVLDKNDTTDRIYILYNSKFNNKDYIFDTDDVITFNTQQYNEVEIDYSVYSTSGKQIELDFTLTRRADDERPEPEVIATQIRQLNSGGEDKFKYSFLTYGIVDVKIATKETDAITKKPLDELDIEVNVLKSDVQISVLKDNSLRLNLEAINRSNSEPADQRNVWKINNVETVKFNNVYFNESSGWDGKALVLNNGANIEIPYNVFGTDANVLNSAGLTFEITFEMVNVQDEEAVMLSFADESNRSNLQLTACGGQITDNGGSEVHTRFNANTKIKLAFVVNPYDRSYDGTGTTYKNCMFLFINGILDKADGYSGSLIWNNAKNPKIVIGDPNGKAGIKLYSVRVYNKALSLDEELTNWMAETDDILKSYERNNIYEEGSSTVSLNILKEKIPTAVLYGDIDKFNKLENKKDNLQFDIEFYDPTDSDRDFYARGVYICNQGTSSLAYPIRNLRPYFSKTVDTKTTKETSAHYYTEVYLSGQFEHGKVTDESTLGHFFTNAKTTKESKGYHKLYNKTQAQKLQSEGEQIFFKDIDDKYKPCTIGVDDNGATAWYINGYREIKGYGVADDAWKVLKDLRLSGFKLYTKDSYEDVENPYSGESYRVYKFKEVKSSAKLSQDKTYYLDQAAWKQYHKSGYAKHWTWKADYASSDMCNNAGVGRLWGDVMKNFRLGTGDNPYAGRTDAQTAMGKIQTADDERIDIRTSCDGKPMVMYICPLKYDEKDEPIIVDGKRQYGDPVFAGLYNIMTDKSSTPLFGFENIYDENGTKIYSADRTECWECVSNAIEYPMGLDVASDKENKENTSMGKRKPLWSGFEARWPDVKVDGEQTAHTQNLESLWRFVNFCKPAVDYVVGSVDGYTLSPWVKVSKEEAEEIWNMAERPALSIGTLDRGNWDYEDYVPSSLEEMMKNIENLYRYDNTINYHDSHKVLSGKTIATHIYKGKVAGFDAKHGVFLEDIQFDAERVENEANGIEFFDPDADVQTATNYAIAGSPVEEDYYVDVFLEQNGSSYRYVDEYGEYQAYRGSVDRDSYEKNGKGESYAGKTYMEYFSDKKYDFFNVYRLAAYYIYLMRFAAADQFVKNSMLMTEDGQHYFYINYDNDTILGVRNDGNLVFHWNVDRDSFDDEKSSFCFAGAKSVLWNLLEQDEDFMSVVQQVDNAMYTSRVLDADIALDMFNNKQEGSWGERMYNINEQYKYLSQWTGSDTKYLKFIHGSSNQYRSWFITNRFNYYDSLWESGSYKSTKIGFRMHIEGTDGKTPFLAITAARPNKFWVYNSDGLMKNLPQWKKQLDQDERGEWPAIYNVQGTSSPWELYGSDKIKVLDFSVATGVFTLQQISFSDNVSWTKDRGCLMTSLLIGNTNEFRDKQWHRYSNTHKDNEDKSDQILTQVNVEAGKVYTSDEKLNVTLPEGIIESENEEGKFVYTNTSDDVVTLPLIVVKYGEYVDRPNQISTVGLFEHTILDQTVVPLGEIGGLNDVYSLEEIDIRNCWSTDVKNQLNDIEINNLNNLHIFRAIGSSITSFKPAIGCTLKEVSLPVNRITTIAFDNTTFMPSDDPENVPTLLYTPDYALRNLTIKNVTFEGDKPAFDIVDFIDKWITAYENEYKGSSNFDLKNLSLTLDGVNIEATPEWLIKLKELNIVSFTGDVYLLNEENGGVITQKQFDDLRDAYVTPTQDPFTSQSSLRFSGRDATFWTVVCDKVKKLEKSEIWGTNLVSQYYEILHGDKLEFRVTKFPLTSKNTRYSFRYLTGNQTDHSQLNKSSWNTNTRLVGQTASTSDNNTNMTIESNAGGGNSTFVSSIAGQPSKNNIKFIKIFTVDDRNNESGDPIFVQINPIVEPEDIILVCDNKELEKSSDGNFIVTFDKNLVEHSFEIKYTNGDEVTVDSMMPSVSFVEPGTQGEGTEVSDIYGVIGNIKLKNDKTKGSTFTIAPKIQAKTVTKMVYITVPFKTGLEESGEKTMELKRLAMKIETKMPNRVEISIPNDYKTKYGDKIYTTPYKVERYDDEGNLASSSTGVKLSINCIIPADGLKFPLVPYINGIDGVDKDVNVPIISMDKNPQTSSSSSFISYPTCDQDEDGNWFVLIKPTQANNGLNSYDAEFDVYLTGNFGFEHWGEEKCPAFTYDWRIDASIIYPDRVKITYEDGLTDITENPLIICEADGKDLVNGKESGQKEIILTVIPYNQLNSDPITVDIDWEKSIVDLDLVPDREATGLIFNLDDTVFTPDAFVKVEKIFGEKYLKLKVTLHKQYYEDGGQPDNVVNRLLPKFSITCVYKNELGAQATPLTEDINFVVEQSLASFQTIDQCEPYNIEGVADNFPWYFVDSSNQYYKFDKSIISKLKEGQKLNSLIGIAKREDYGWGEDKDVADNLSSNNASNIWRQDPMLDIKLNSNKKWQRHYYRPICIPLVNWFVYDDIMNKTTSTILGQDSPNWKAVKDNANQYGAWILKRSRLMEVETNDGKFEGVVHPLFNTVFTGKNQNSNEADVTREILKGMIHLSTSDIRSLDGNKYYNPENVINCINNRQIGVDKNQASVNTLNNAGTSIPYYGSVIDNKVAMEMFCGGKYPEWMKADGESEQLSAGFENMLKDSNYLTNITFPGYGGKFNQISGLLDTWFHFIIYKNAIIDKNDSSSITDLSSLRCYTANMYELMSVFNGYGDHIEDYGEKTRGNLVVHLLEKDTNGVITPNDTVTEENSTLVPYGIYQLHYVLEKSECKAALGVKDNKTLFVDSLYEFFSNNELVKSTLSNNPFISLTMHLMSNAQINGSAIGYNGMSENNRLMSVSFNNGLLSNSSTWAAAAGLYFPLLIIK